MAQLGKPLVVRLLAGAAAILLAVGVGYLFTRGAEKVAEANAPDVGDCLAMSGTLAAPEHEEADCDDAAAAYVVLSDRGGCGALPELPYTISSGEGKDGDIADLCLDLHAAVGDCFTQKDLQSFATKVDCARVKEDRNAVEVVSIGKADDQCVTGAQPRRNATRDTLLCLGPTT